MSHQDQFFAQTSCSRCGGNLATRIMSKFDLATICGLCKEDERLAPGYAAADQAELEAVRSGNYNFPGIGLSDEDHKFLAERRAQRVQQPQTQGG